MSDPKLLMLDEPSLELALGVSGFATVLQVGESVLSGTTALARK
jgi:hypothetical protein